MTFSKVVESAQAAVADVPDGASLAVGGFGLCGNPMGLIRKMTSSYVGENKEFARR